MDEMDVDNDAKRAQWRRQLERLTLEHRDLDETIRDMAHSVLVDAPRMQRLKKRKLAIKDEIRELHKRLLPDIIA